MANLINADELYEYLDNKYPFDKYVEIEDILVIIEKFQTVNAIEITPNLTNKGLIKKAFSNIDIDFNQIYKGYFCGYRNKTELRPIVWFDKKWLNEKCGKENK